MTGAELISITRLAAKVDEMSRDMITKSLLVAEIGRIDAAFEAHVEYTKAAAAAEVKRLDSVREVDATAVRLANDRAAEQAGILAKNLEAGATTLRELVSTTASAAAKNLAQQFAPIITRLGAIEAKQYENQGRAGVTDPMMASFVAKMETVVTTMAEGKGKQAISTPVLMLIASAVSGFIVWLIQSGMAK